MSNLLLAAIENTRIEPRVPVTPDMPEFPWPSDDDAPEPSELAPEESDPDEPDPDSEPLPLPVPPKRIQQTFVRLTGNTYPVRDQLRALGAKWNKAAKAWEVPENRATDAARIVQNAPVRERTNADWIAINARKRGGIPGMCRSCGSGCKYPYDECWDCKSEREGR